MGLPIETRLSGQSYWATAAGTKTGVAIPIDPYGANKDVRPILEDAWNEHFIAVEGKVNGTRLILMSVYGPHQRGRRELFFDRLAGLEVPLDGLVALGGDFNSTLDAQTDRSYSTDRSAYDSPALWRLLDAWRMVNPAGATRPASWGQETLCGHHQTTHTYHCHHVNGYGGASS
ncbi:hypothetical protein PC116_g20212 [Phytophthora cactorum]|nr:hypothetical protein PC114_g17680 [Phytophthora cactorum]KAG3000224.1 hypothetical protein PC119_g17051 [Phytophthora cactorum]KAG3146285.1 hypothetical protein C6341_g18080 [Phytophthora cactorum]KAG3172033.1 hypothetical protein PC128_g18590 [Phytophthora cactorum]KAG4049196.1 hypothetical protein PC123_g15517 [Phytophthora cactorum]